MFAQCPLCNAIFRVNAAQLGAARGQVRCGSCHEIFDAIEHLRDDEFVERAVTEARNREQAQAQAEDVDPSDELVEAEPPRITNTVVAASESTSSDLPSPGELPPAPTDSGLPEIRADVAQRLGTVSRDEAPAEPETVAEVATRTAPEPEPIAPAEAVVPEAIRADLERVRNARSLRKRAMAFGVGGAVLLVALVAQNVWFNPIDASRSYPQWHPYIEQFCDWTGCVLPQRREPGLVRVLSRDVRVHPRYEGALQITATLVNSAPFRQPYPHMSFSLFNVNGQTIATRTFSPTEYLGAPVDGQTLFEPGIPLQIGLEVLAPDDVAVSFEFTFL